jgi:hypothetical protein
VKLLYKKYGARGILRISRMVLSSLENNKMTICRATLPFERLSVKLARIKNSFAQRFTVRQNVI